MWAAVSKRGREDLAHVRGQGQRPRVPGCDGAGTAERSYPASEVSGGREETPHIRGQGWRPGGATRGGVAAQAQEGLEELSPLKVRNSGSKEITFSKVRSSSCALLEQP